MKKLFVLADSISIHYGPFLEEYIKDVFDYNRKGKNQECENLNIASPVNGGDSSNVLEYLELFPNLEYDVMLLNCGLHDIKTHPDGIQIPIEQYELNLKKITELIHTKGKKAVWVTSTPVDDDRHNSINTVFSRFNKDIIKYNEVAKKVMNASNVPIIDLYGFTKRLNIPLYEDHIHYLEPVRKLHASFIAGHLSAFEQMGKI